MATVAARRPKGSDFSVSGSQRGRLLDATFAVVEDHGFEGVSARRVAERAGVSTRVFYECFSDREDCFLAAFNHAIDALELEARAGWESQLGWTARVRGALAALLQALDREPAIRRLVFVEALAAGPRVLARRASVLEGLAGVVDQGRVNAPVPGLLPGLVAEGVVGGAFGVIHARLLELRSGPLLALLGPLMAMIVLPYRGPTAAAKELERPVPRSVERAAGRDRDGLSRRVGVASPVDYRLTVRTQMALAAVAGRPGLSNLEVSEVIGVADQSQISRMMKRLQDQGLVENAQAHTKRQARAWRLTADGEAVVDAHPPLKQARRKAGRGEKLPTTRSAAGRRGKTQPATTNSDTTGISGAGLRMTALTRDVLGVIAELGTQGLAPSNREIARVAAVKDQGQISKLLARLQAHGLLENAGGGYPAAGNAWRLTARGEMALQQTTQTVADGRSSRAHLQVNGTRETR
jgi:AcrR family transcriptional regulator/DNA-binding MarR family transcriptional regulator